MAHDVFVSYSTHDKTTADAVCAVLEANGIECWIAPRDIFPGMDWSEAIINAIQTSRVMILVFSSHANDSQQVRREVERAANRGLLIMPLRIENVTPTKSLAYFIGPVHWLDALTPPLERHLQNLAEAVRLLLSRLGQDEGTIESQNSPAEITEEEGRQVRRQEKRLPQMPAQSARSRFKKTAVILMVVGSLGLGLTFYSLWHRVDQGLIREEAQPQEEALDRKPYKAPEKAEKAEQRRIGPSNGEAICYDEAAFKSVVTSLRKIEERYSRELIDIVEREQHRRKLVNDFNHLMAQGASTEFCILQQLGLVKSLYNDQLIDIVQESASRKILYTKLHNLCVPRAVDVIPIEDCLNLMNVAYDQQLIDIIQLNASRQILWKALHDILLARAQTEKEVDEALDVVKQLYGKNLIDIMQLNETRKALSKK